MLSETDEGESDEETKETFILCSSRDRIEKDKAIVKRSAGKIAARLTAMQARCEKQNRNQLTVSREIGRLLGQNTRGARLFEVTVVDKEQPAESKSKNSDSKNAKASKSKSKRRTPKFAKIQWNRIKEVNDWHELSDGCYLLRSNVRDWSEEELWKAYIQLTEAENAFRIHKTDLSSKSPSDLAPERGSRPGASICVFLVVRALEDDVSEVQAGWLRR